MTRTLFILFHGRFPSEKAAALFAADTARAFSHTFNVTIVVPRRLSRMPGSPHTLYDLPGSVRIISLPMLDLFSVPLLSSLAFAVSMVCYSVGVLFMLLGKAREGDVVISNDPLPALIASLTPAKVVYEVHDYPEHWKWLYHLVFSRASAVIATNAWKREALAREFPSLASSFVMERNGVDLGLFGAPLDKQESRKVLGLPTEGPIVVYTGHLYDWKGTESLAKAARLMKDLHFYFVGGTPEDVSRYRDAYKSASHITFVGHVPHAAIPQWQAAADVLVLPNTGTKDIAAQYTSPMKLFEYMASERPIVAARLPAIVEIVGEECAYLFTPDDERSLTETIYTALVDPKKKALNARKHVQEFSWHERTQRLLRLAPFRTV